MHRASQARGLLADVLHAARVDCPEYAAATGPTSSAAVARLLHLHACRVVRAPLTSGCDGLLMPLGGSQAAVVVQRPASALEQAFTLRHLTALRLMGCDSAVLDVRACGADPQAIAADLFALLDLVDRRHGAAGINLRSTTPAMQRWHPARVQERRSILVRVVTVLDRWSLL